jgi:hypothetical protein
LALEGIESLNKTHAMSKTPVYAIWVAMKMRCTNPHDKNFPDYGGRGITVCERWRTSFEAFYADMGNPPPGLTLERRRNDVGYFPENCLWTTRTAQAHNQRSNRLVPYRGEMIPVTEAARRVGRSRAWVNRQVQQGIPL